MILDKAKLRRGLALAAAIDGGRSAIATIRGTVLLSPGDGVLRIQATDLDHHIDVHIAATGEAELEPFVIGAKTLAPLLKGEGEVNLRTKGRVLEVETGDASTRILSAGDPAERPARPKTADGDGTPIVGATLARELPWLLSAASVDETRYVLNGVYFHDGRGCATDGHRLHVSTIEGMPTCLVARSGVEALRRMAEEAIVVQFSTNGNGDAPTGGPLTWEAMAIGDGLAAHVIGKCIDGQFPDYAEVIPKAAPACEPDVRALLAFHKANPMRRGAREGAKESGIKWTLNGALELFAQDPDRGESRATVACSGHKGQKVEVWFNPRYVIEAVAKDKAFTFSVTDEKSPVVFALSNGRKAIVMPMKM